MGLDLWLQSKICKECGTIKKSESEIFSITYNLSPMWHLIFPNDDGMIDIDGMTGKQSLKKLIHARDQLTDKKDKFISLNPDNGWGSYESFLICIKKLIKEAEENPKSVWISWR